MIIQTRSQRISAAVLIHQPDNIDKKLRTVALSFPTMVLQSGLAQSVAFFTAKAGNDDQSEHKRLLMWLTESLGNTNLEELNADIRDGDLTHYRNLTRDVLEAAMWIKRYVQAHS